jgi:hypothetical protein
MTQHTPYVYREGAELSSTDLLEEMAQALAQGQQAETATIILADEDGYLRTNDHCGDALYLPSVGRIGIAWGAGADWADADGLDAGIHMYIMDSEEFEARN